MSIDVPYKIYACIEFTCASRFVSIFIRFGINLWNVVHGFCKNTAQNRTDDKFIVDRNTEPMKKKTHLQNQFLDMPPSMCATFVLIYIVVVIDDDGDVI